jgi:phospholipid transport system substrate-binding protein
MNIEAIASNGTSGRSGWNTARRPSYLLKTILQLLAAYFLVATYSAIAADATPDAMVKSTVEDVLAVIKTNKDKQALRQLAEQKVLPHFDFKHMTQLAMGTAWKQANPAQQQALENSFRTLLVNIYTSALSMSSSGNQTVEIKAGGGKTDGNEATVKTVVKDPGKEPVAIDYHMEKTADGWKVYDVVVENLSLVTNYRGTFATEVNRSGIDGLIKVLEDKNHTLAKG